MAVISKYIRHDGITIRFLPLANNGFVLDNRAYNSDFINMNNNPIDAPTDVINACYAGYPTYMYKKMYNRTAVWYNTYLNSMEDVSGDNPVYGKPYATDPYEDGVSYLICHGDRYNAIKYIYKFDKYGNILAKNQNTMNNMFFPVIVDITKDYLVLKMNYYYNGYYTEYVYYADKNTLSVGSVNGVSGKSLNFGPQYDNLQIIERTQGAVWLISKYNNANAALYKVNYDTPSPLQVKTSISPNSTEIPASNYGNGANGIATCPYTPTMKNGWHYRMRVTQSLKDQPVTFEAVKIDTVNNVYETLHSGAITINYQAGVDESKSVNKWIYTEASAGSNVYFTHKLNDNFFVVFYTIDQTNDSHLTYRNNGHTSRMWLFETDPTDPTNIKCHFCQDMETLYDGYPLMIARDFFGFILEDTAIHGYKIDLNTKTINKVWDLATPNIGWATIYNGYLWWFNAATKTISYEAPGDSKNTVLVVPEEHFQLENDKDIKTTSIKVGVTDSNGRYLQENLVVTLEGPARFLDGTTSQEVITLGTGLRDINIEIYNGGMIAVKAEPKE